MVKTMICIDASVNPHPVCFQSLFMQADLIDAWQELNPLLWDYTYSSDPNNLYICIDQNWVKRSTLPILSRARILPIPWSDHGHVIL